MTIHDDMAAIILAFSYTEHYGVCRGECERVQAWLDAQSGMRPETDNLRGIVTEESRIYALGFVNGMADTYSLTPYWKPIEDGQCVESGGDYYITMESYNGTRIISVKDSYYHVAYVSLPANVDLCCLITPDMEESE